MDAGGEAVFSLAIEAWERADLSAERHVTLDGQGLQIADNQEKSAEGREALKEVIRAFKTVPPEDRANKVGGVIKAFQSEVDALTRRQSSAEAAFLALYRSLDDVPDPLPLLRTAATGLEQHTALLTEATGLRQQLADYDQEFASLKNQDATIRRLQKQLAEAEARADAATQEAATAAAEDRERQHADELAATCAEAADREAALVQKLRRAEDDARKVTRAHSDAQEALFEQRATFDQQQAATAADNEELRAQAETASARYLTLEKAHVALEARVGGANEPEGGAAGAAAREELKVALASVGRLEELLAARELQLARTSAELAASERIASAAEERVASEASTHVAALAAVRAELEARPSTQAHQGLVEEAQALRQRLHDVGEGHAGAAGGAPQAAELLAAAGVSSGGAEGGSRHMRSLMAANTQRLQAELSVAHAQVASLEKDLDGARAAETRAASQLSEQAGAIAALEDELLRARQMHSAMNAAAAKAAGGGEMHTPRPPPGSRSAGASTLSAVLTSGGGTGGANALLTPGTPAMDAGDELSDDTLRLVVVQRERARKHANELEAENRRYADQCKAYQSENRKLSADNLRLYEKAKFLEAQAASAAAGRDGISGGNGAAGAVGSNSSTVAATGGAAGVGPARPSVVAPTTLGKNSIAEASTEGRYSRMYEEKVNPFAAFHRRERQQRYDGLHPADKVVLNFAKFVAANKHARLGLLGYVVCLHLLVWGSMYAATHHC